MVKTWRIPLPNVRLEGWAVFLLDSNGMLSVTSDFGNYSYHWPPNGIPGGEFLQFLLQADREYIARKLSNGRRVLNGEATTSLIRERICQLRREKYFTSKQARDEWNIHALRHGITDELEFHEWFLETVIPDAAELSVQSLEGDLKLFMERVWPRFIGKLAADLQTLLGNPKLVY